MDVKNKVRRSLTTTIAAGALAVGGLATAAPPAQAATMLGGLNLAWFCAATNAARPTWVVVVPPGNVYSWRCIVGGGQVKGMNMNQACNWTYGPSYASYLNYNDALTWRCFR